jgi:hypothetical protein
LSDLAGDGDYQHWLGGVTRVDLYRTGEQARLEPVRHEADGYGIAAVGPEWKP